MKKIGYSVLAKNVTIVLLVQVVSTIISFIIGFIVPKYISELTYSEWQVYMLYVNFSAIFHFGLYDGFLLRYSRYDYDELNVKNIRTQFFYLNFLLDLIGLIVILFTYYFSQTSLLIVALIVVGIIFRNLFRYQYYGFQMTNNINDYSLCVLIERVVYVGFVVLLLVLKNDNYVLYCICDIVGCAAGFVYGIIRRPKMVFGCFDTPKETLKEIKKNVFVGIFVTIAVFSFSFLVSGAKMTVQWRWDKLTFGQVSFSISIMNVFLTFITAASSVLLPSLKRLDQEELPKFYKQMRGILSVVLFCGILLYFPAKIILEKWLPNYSDGLFYVGIILPSVIFSSKVNLLTNNYLKNYFKEKILLLINISTMILGIGIFLFSAYVLNDLLILLYSINILCLINSVVAEIVVSKIINIKLYLEYLIEFVMAIVFIIIVRTLSSEYAFLIYLGCVILYLIYYWKSILTIFEAVRKKLRRKA